MNKTDMLWIRACKTFEPEKRLKSLYRRFYCSRPLDNYTLTQFLLQIVEKHNMLSTRELINDLNPHRYLTVDTRDYWTRVSSTLLSAIRLYPIPRIEGYIYPSRFNRHKPMRNPKNEITNSK